MSALAQPETPSDRDRMLGGALSVAASLVWLAQAWVIARAVSSLLSGVQVAPVLTALAFAGLGVARAVLNRSAQQVLSRAAEAEITALRAEITAREASTTEPSQFGGAGAIAALATDKIEALRPYLLRYTPARLRVMVVPIVILAITAWYSWAAAVVLLAAGPLIPVFMALVGWAAKEASARQMAEIGSLNDLLADRLAALSDLKLIHAGGQVVDGFADASDALRLRTMAVLRIAFLSSTVLELFAALGVAMIAVWVGFSLLGELAWGTWGVPLTPFAGVLLLLLAPDFFQPLRDLAAAWHDKSAADAVYRELESWRDDRRLPLMGQGGSSPPAPFAGLSTRGLVVSRGDVHVAFPDLDLSAGESLAISGPSGIGKTSLLRLLAGLDTPSRGTVRLGQTDLTAGTADAWRASVGWMPQSPRFLAQSLRYNIGFGASLDGDVLETARVAQILHTLPDGEGTRLGETGAGLSGGEARRVMLARALHGKPGILLADEPTADLDSETAQDIIDGLLTFVAQGGTLVAATHDPRLIAQMQRHIRLEAQA